MCTNTTLHIVRWRLAGLHTNLETERQGFPCGPGERWPFTLPFQLLYNLTLIHKKQEMIANKPASTQPSRSLLQANCAFHAGRVSILPMLKQGGAQCTQTAQGTCAKACDHDEAHLAWASYPSSLYRLGHKLSMCKPQWILGSLWHSQPQCCTQKRHSNNSQVSGKHLISTQCWRIHIYIMCTY